jgi:hypothetical protein
MPNGLRVGFGQFRLRQAGGRINRIGIGHAAKDIGVKKYESFKRLLWRNPLRSVAFGPQCVAAGL